MELRRLCKDDYDELIGLMNYVFSKKNKREMSFEAELPKMCQRTDEAMNKHFGIIEDGKIVAALGVYPLPCKINGKSFLFSTVGNVATHPDYEGRGYMGVLMKEAMAELRRIGADASRLGGARQRYNRFGYEMAGVAYTFTVNDHNTKHAFGPVLGFEFERIEKLDTGALSYVKALHEKQKIYSVRSDRDGFFEVYASAAAWQATPFTVKKNGKRVGYISIAKDEATVSELYTEKDEDFAYILVAYQRAVKKPITVTLPEYETALCAKLASFAANVTVSPVCHFKIISFATIADALMNLKSTYTQMPSGKFVLGIADYGNVKLYSEGGRCGAAPTDEAADVTLGHLEATRFLFGCTPASLLADIPSFVKLWLPLPLYWNLQDRV